MSIRLQCITDQNGIKNAVLLNIRDWEKVQKDLEEYRKLKEKRTFFEGLSNAFYEVKLITSKEKQSNSFGDLLNEL
jgi:hypothetical protein